MLNAEFARQDLFKACESLFGEDVDVSVEFLRYLQPAGLKAAFRKKAMETHPDRALTLACRKDILEKRFKEINLAYQLLQDFLSCPWKFSLDEHGSIYRPKRNTPPRSQRSDYIRKPKNSRRVPSRKLLFGQYLYYSGHIELNTLVKAIVWQRLQRPSVGSLAAQWDWLDADRIYDTLKRRSNGEKFGECALRLGYLSKYQLMLLLNKQKLLQPQIGRYFIEQRILSPFRIMKLIEELRAHNNKFWHL